MEYPEYIVQEQIDPSLRLRARVFVSPYTRQGEAAKAAEAEATQAWNDLLKSQSSSYCHCYTGPLLLD
jgi:hypothetical protein